MYISEKYKQIVMAPFKCGSTTVEHMFQTRFNWDNIYQGKKMTTPSEVLSQYIDRNLFLDYKIHLLVRNPFDFIISGFRHMLRHNENFKPKIGFPDLTSHLLAIKNNNVKNNHWLKHCQYQPFDYYNQGFIIHKLEKFDVFLNYLDVKCKKDYEPLPNFHLNKQKTIPYPSINEFEENLIIELTKKAADHTKYNIPKSISVYRERYKSGELNELFT